MREHDEWPSMPLDPDVRRYAKAVSDYQMEERATMNRFAPMLCRCQAWYDWRMPEAPQVDCMIHTTIMFGRDGELMLRAGAVSAFAWGTPTPGAR